MENYRVLSEVGSGSYGKIYLSEQRDTKERVVIKKIDYATLDSNAAHIIRSEIATMRKFDSKYIVKFYDSFKLGSVECIVMEYCNNGDLFRLIDETKIRKQRVPEGNVMAYGYQILKALKEIHAENIIHRDLKPENILLTRLPNKYILCKVGDFGLSRVLGKGRQFAQTFAGSPLYMAPELVTGKKYSNKVDIWSLGCILYELCSLRPAFEASDLPKIMNNIKSKDIPDLPFAYSKAAQKFVNSMLVRNPKDRPNVETLLCHSIFKKNEAFLPKAGMAAPMPPSTPSSTPDSPDKHRLDTGASSTDSGAEEFAMEDSGKRGAFDSHSENDSDIDMATPLRPRISSSVVASFFSVSLRTDIPSSIASVDKEEEEIGSAASSLSEVKGERRLHFLEFASPDGLFIRTAEPAAISIPLSVPVPRHHTVFLDNHTSSSSSPRDSPGTDEKPRFIIPGSRSSTGSNMKAHELLDFHGDGTIRSSTSKNSSKTSMQHMGRTSDQTPRKQVNPKTPKAISRSSPKSAVSKKSKDFTSKTSTAPTSASSSRPTFHGYSKTPLPPRTVDLSTRTKRPNLPLPNLNLQSNADISESSVSTSSPSPIGSMAAASGCKPKTPSVCSKAVDAVSLSPSSSTSTSMTSATAPTLHGFVNPAILGLSHGRPHTGAGATASESRRHKQAKTPKAGAAAPRVVRHNRSSSDYYIKEQMKQTSFSEAPPIASAEPDLSARFAGVLHQIPPSTNPTRSRSQSANSFSQSEQLPIPVQKKPVKRNTCATFTPIPATLLPTVSDGSSSSSTTPHCRSVNSSSSPSPRHSPAIARSQGTKKNLPSIPIPHAPVRTPPAVQSPSMVSQGTRYDFHLSAPSAGVAAMTSQLMQSETSFSTQNKRSSYSPWPRGVTDSTINPSPPTTPPVTAPTDIAAHTSPHSLSKERAVHISTVSSTHSESTPLSSGNSSPPPTSGGQQARALPAVYSFGRLKTQSSGAPSPNATSDSDTATRKPNLPKHLSVGLMRSNTLKNYDSDVVTHIVFYNPSDGSGVLNLINDLESGPINQIDPWIALQEGWTPILIDPIECKKFCSNPAIWNRYEMVILKLLSFLGLHIQLKPAIRCTIIAEKEDFFSDWFTDTKYFSVLSTLFRSMRCFKRLHTLLKCVIMVVFDELLKVKELLESVRQNDDIIHAINDHWFA